MTTTESTSTPPAALLLAAPRDHEELSALLRDVGFETLVADATERMDLPGHPVSLCLVDLRQNGDALRSARALRTEHPETVIIGVADPARPWAAADALRAGVFDVLPRPAAARDLEALLTNAREQAALALSQNGHGHAEPAAAFGIVGTSPAMRLLMELVERAAPGRCGMLICGERGSGREMVARAIHQHGTNRNAPFVKVDCSAPGLEDIELDLFGAAGKRGGAEASKRRDFECISRDSRLAEAAHGILFLENLAELPARAQSRLVRVLRDREAFIDERRTPVALDIRPIAAVDPSIRVAVEDGHLRADLFERLSPIRLDVPALRQRREDIPALATHFLKELCRTSHSPVKTLTRPALTLLSALSWRGNALELRTLLERLVLLVPGGLIRLEDVLAHVQFDGGVSPSGPDGTLREAREKFEQDYIEAVLQHHHGRIADAAKVLGIQRTNLYRKMRRLNLMRPKPAARGW